MQKYILPNVHSWAHRNPLTDTFPPIIGMIYKSEKSEKLMTGSNQDWYSFKRDLVEHISCSSVRSAGQVHLEVRCKEIFR